MQETPQDRLKRLRLRSWRRGIKEMDLILGSWADSELENMCDDELALYDELLSENDHDLYRWVSTTAKPPEKFANLLKQISMAFEKVHSS